MCYVTFIASVIIIVSLHRYVISLISSSSIVGVIQPTIIVITTAMTINLSERTRNVYSAIKNTYSLVKFILSVRSCLSLATTKQ